MKFGAFYFYGKDALLMPTTVFGCGPQVIRSIPSAIFNSGHPTVYTVAYSFTDPERMEG